MTKFISYDEFINATLCNYVGDESKVTPGSGLIYLSSLKEYDSRLGTEIKKDEAGIFITITDEPIKIDTFNLNVTGDKYANMLWGNNSDNVVKGMNGNDILYGRGGNDKIYGGNGDDIIVGNEAFSFVANVAGFEDPFTYNTVTDFKNNLNDAGVLDEALTERLNAIKVEAMEEKNFTDLTQMYKYLQANVPNGINTLDGGAGNDHLWGGRGSDEIETGKGNDVYIEGKEFGQDEVMSKAGSIGAKNRP